MKFLFLLVLPIAFINSAYSESKALFGECTAKIKTSRGRYSGCEVLINRMNKRKLRTLITSAERCENYCETRDKVLNEAMELGLGVYGIVLQERKRKELLNQPICLRSVPVFNKTKEYSACRVVDAVPNGPGKVKTLDLQVISNADDCTNHCKSTLGELYPSDPPEERRVRRYNGGSEKIIEETQGTE